MTKRRRAEPSRFGFLPLQIGTAQGGYETLVRHHAGRSAAT